MAEVSLYPSARTEVPRQRSQRPEAPSGPYLTVYSRIPSSHPGSSFDRVQRVPRAGVRERVTYARIPSSHPGSSFDRAVRTPVFDAPDPEPAVNAPIRSGSPGSSFDRAVAADRCRFGMRLHFGFQISQGSSVALYG